MGTKADGTAGSGVSRRALLAAGLGWLGAWWMLGSARGKAPVAKTPRFVCLDKSLLDEDIGNAFIDEGNKVLAQWDKLGTAEARIQALWQALNLALVRAGIPQVMPPVVRQLDEPLSAQLVPGTWRHEVDSKDFGISTLVREEGIERLTFVYHEARHVEQFWLLARWRVAKGARTVKSLRTEIGVPPAVARAALACPLRPGRVPETTLEAWYKNYKSTMTREHNRLIDAFQWKGGPDVDAGPARGGPQTAAEQQALDRYHLQALQEDAEMAREWLKVLIQRRKPMP